MELVVIHIIFTGLVTKHIRFRAKTLEWAIAKDRDMEDNLDKDKDMVEDMNNLNYEVIICGISSYVVAFQWFLHL